MKLRSMIFMFVGLFIMISLVLAHVFGQADLSKPSFLWFTAFIGINLFQTSFTGFCPLAIILKALGVKE